VSSTQALVPIVASLEETHARQQFGFLYATTFRFMVFLALPYYAVLLTAVPIISHLWIGGYETTFVIFSILLLVGASINTFIAPAYVAYVGKGRLRWITISHVLIAALNIVLGALLGSAFGAIGVAIGSFVALIAGSAVVIAAFHLEEHIPVERLQLRANVWLLCGSVTSAGGGLSAYSYFLSSQSISVTAATLISLFLCSVLPAIWLHPMRSATYAWLTSTRKASASAMNVRIEAANKSQ
jgi:O-antigen/teichoic acid export membrane protein